MDCNYAHKQEQQMNNQLHNSQIMKEIQNKEATIKLRYIFDVGNNKFDEALYSQGIYKLHPDFLHLLRPLKLMPERIFLTPKQRNMALVNYYGIPAANNFEHNVKPPELILQVCLQMLNQ